MAALKEQLSAANYNPGDKMSGAEDIKRSSAEAELNAKDKEVSSWLRTNVCIRRLNINSAT